MRGRTRRRFIRAGVAVSLVGIAGCSGEKGNDGSDGQGGTDGDTGLDEDETSIEPNTGTTTDGGGIDGDNYIFVTEDELQTQKNRVDTGRQPWKEAYNHLISNADSATNMKMKSVADDGGGHTFAVENGRHDYTEAALSMSHGAQDCGLAYWFTGNDEYARRVVELIHHWALNEDTYMKPTVNVANTGVTVSQHVTIPGFFYAASFVRDHPAWNKYDGAKPWEDGSAADAEAAFKQWVDDRYQTFPKYAQDTKTENSWCEYNNKWAWRIADRAAAAAYLGADDYIDRAKKMYKAEARQCTGDSDPNHRPWTDFENEADKWAYDGSANPKKNALFKSELVRDNGYVYTAYNLEAMMLSPMVFNRYDGTDLWGFNAPTDDHGGSSLWKALNWFADYARDTSAWVWDKDDSIENYAIQNAGLVYEYAYAYWKDTDKNDFEKTLNEIDGASRPFFAPFLLNHPTLIHGAE